MMLPTHAVLGMALAVPIAALAPEHAGTVLAAGFIGGVLPDFDLYVGHRKTLHYPVLFPLAALALAPLAAVVPTTASLGALTVALAAGVHSASDVLGGGLELRPWEGTSDRAVYDHLRGRWLAPRRWVGYDGSPGDLALSLGVGLPLIVTLDGPARLVVLGTLAVGALYAAVRRTLPRIAERLLGSLLAHRLTPRAAAALPERYVSGAGLQAGTASAGTGGAGGPVED